MITYLLMYTKYCLLERGTVAADATMEMPALLFRTGAESAVAPAPFSALLVNLAPLFAVADRRRGHRYAECAVASPACLSALLVRLTPLGGDSVETFQFFLA